MLFFRNILFESLQPALFMYNIDAAKDLLVRLGYQKNND